MKASSSGGLGRMALYRWSRKFPATAARRSLRRWVKRFAHKADRQAIRTELHRMNDDDARCPLYDYDPVDYD